MRQTVSIILLCAICASCEKSAKPVAATGDSPKSADLSNSVGSGCDDSLWNHVYDPTRLEKLAPCLTVTGIIDESATDVDGDQHFLLRLDPGQDSLLTKRNRKKKQNDLVLEIVCANPVHIKKAKSACLGYTNRIPIPAVGTHVRATGTYVNDSHNGWTEIHPVSKLQGM